MLGSLLNVPVTFRERSPDRAGVMRHTLNQGREVRSGRATVVGAGIGSWRLRLPSNAPDLRLSSWNKPPN